MDYKASLLLPQTSFEMRANLPQHEPARFAKWLNQNYAYEKMKKKRQGAARLFTFHDGPPYANGSLHIGHALNKILKESIVKLHYFKGEAVRFTPGWDCHGLPIEQQVEIKLGEKKAGLSKASIRAACREHAGHFVRLQKKEFQALGVLADWDKPYLTMDFKIEAEIYRTLCAVARRGLLRERSKPVFWSWAARSALAEAEVEYEEKEDYSLFAAFELGPDAREKLKLPEGSPARAVIWTTTPWTLVANQAIALHPREKYVLTTEGLIFAAALLESMKKLGLTSGELAQEFPSTLLEKTHAINPLNARPSLFILGEHVLMDGGSGLVHTAPGHGEDDYYACLAYGLSVLMPVDDGGLYDESLRSEGLLPPGVVDEFVGMHIFKANERLISLLGSSALSVSKFTHSYPFCWRTHKPVIYRATKQWFIAMDEAIQGEESGGKTLRQIATEELKKTSFYPPRGFNRINTMVENRPDWCISRQRAWGTPIAFLRDRESREVILDEVVLEHIARIFEERGADAWWELEISDLLPANSKYDPARLEKIDDILDVWFDSGSSWAAVLESGLYDAGEGVASMYLEGSDQHRGWFQSSLLISSAVRGGAPFTSILTHGFTTDEKGQKMSKSKGNVIAPDYIQRTYGVEILRLWVFLSDYSGDLKISENILKQIAEQYRKIRNTLRFLLANTNDLAELNTDNLGLLDKWILGRASLAFAGARGHFFAYEFSRGFNLLLSFLSTDLSGIYLDLCKDRLYCDAASSPRRVASQSAMALIARALLALLSPFLTYTVDEALEHASEVIKNGAEDVFDLLISDDLAFDTRAEDEFLLRVREGLYEQVDVLKKNKLIKSTLELNLKSNSKLLNSIASDELADFFILSLAYDPAGELLASFELEGEFFELRRASLHKCPRCWKYEGPAEETPCPRCAEVLALA